MPLSSPLPSGLASECRKAAQTFKAFVDPVNGLDKLIPSEVLRSAKGFAILTLVKAGFVFSARAGTGVVIARLPSGAWSAPSAIGTGGLGFGGQAGAELTEFIIVLNNKAAVKSFMSAGSVTLGGNLSIAVGPLGRNAEGTGALNTKGKVAAMYSYSRTKGLFGGVSIEGSIIVERSDANSKAYGQDVSAKQLLSGAVDAPEFADILINTIKQRAGNEMDTGWIDDAPSPSESKRSRGYSFGSPYAAIGSGDTPTRSKDENEFDDAFGRHSPRNTREKDPFADRSSVTWRDQDTDEGEPRASLDTINSEGDERDRIWQPPPQPDPPAPSPKLKKPLFRSNRSRSSSTASVGRSNFAFDPTLDGGAAADRRTPPPPSSKSRLSPFNRSRSSSSANKQQQSDFVVPPALHEANASLERSPLSRSHQKSPSLDVANDSHDLIGVGAPAASLRQSQRDRDVTTGVQSLHVSRGSRDFSFGNGTARQAKMELSPPRFLKTDTRTASFGAGDGQAIALYDFDGQEAGDLSFKRDDVITIVKRMDGEQWWRGRIGMKEGIFPLNRVEVMK